MSPYVKSVLTGKMIAVNQGFSQRELNGPLLHSQTPFPGKPKAMVTMPMASQPNNQLPPYPTLSALGAAPAQSQILVLGAYSLTSASPPSQGVPYLQETNTNNYYPVYVKPGSGNNTQYLTPWFPFQVYLLYRRYWQLVYGEIVSPGTPSVSGSYAVTEGMDSTTEVSLGAELGLAVAGLGVTLTANFGFSVTISQSTTATTDIQWTNPNTDASWVVAKYQLVDDIVFATSEAGDAPLVQYSGYYRTPGHNTKHWVTLAQPDSLMGGAQFVQLVFGPF